CYREWSSDVCSSDLSDKKAVPQYDGRGPTQPTTKERLMSKKKSNPCAKSGGQTFVLCLRKYLTPAFYKQVHSLVPDRRHCRWEQIGRASCREKGGGG